MKTLVKMANGFWSNGTFRQIEHKKLTSLVKMTNVFYSNGTSYAYYIPIYLHTSWSCSEVLK